MIPNIILWLRWSWRDLRERWAQVGAVALIIALGTGVYAGLGSTTPWRYQATDKAYSVLHTYDLRLKFILGSYVDADKLVQTVTSIDHATWIKAAEPRLILSEHIDASTSDQDILIPGHVIGMDSLPGGRTSTASILTRDAPWTRATAGRTSRSWNTSLLPIIIYPQKAMSS